MVRVALLLACAAGVCARHSLQPASEPQKVSLHQQHGAKKHRVHHLPFFVLKTGRSGSTWFSDLVRTMLKGDLHEELYHGRKGATGAVWGANITVDGNRRAAADMEAKMMKKLRDGSAFTINPKNTPCVNFNRVARAASAVVLFERCNGVKHAISYLRSAYTQSACGGLKSSDCPKEKSAKPMVVSPDVLRNALVCTYRRSQIALSAFLSVVDSVPHMQVTYEGLQSDADGELQRLAELIELGEHAKARMIDRAQLDARSKTSPVPTKTGTDSLRKVSSRDACMHAGSARALTVGTDSLRIEGGGQLCGGALVARSQRERLPRQPVRRPARRRVRSVPVPAGVARPALQGGREGYAGSENDVVPLHSLYRPLEETLWRRGRRDIL